MTTETMQPQVELEAAPAAGQGDSKGHRRRRRRRKNKSSQSAPAPQGQQPQVQAAPQPPPQPLSRPSGQQQPARKKKFFQKKPLQQAQPGNSINPPAQNRRKVRQKGPREFVGPMDHSYRVANGNVADSPPATIQINGNGGSYYNDSFVPQTPVAVRADAPTRIFCFIEDLFFLAKINETARKLGVKVEFIKGADKETIARLTEAPEAERPALLVFDLNNANAKPLTVIPKFKAKLKKATSIIGFLSHVQGDLKMKATEAGCDTVMPRSAFSQSLPNLLRRYGVEEEEEYVPQPV